MSRRRGAWRTGLVVVLAVTGVAALPAAHAAADAGPATAKLRADFNGDGYADLAVGAPSGTVGGRTEAGYVAVLYGTAHGLSTTGRKVFSQNTAGVPGTAEKGDRFGSALTTADLDRDGYTDLIVGVGGEDTASGGTDSGCLEVVWGGPRGLSGASSLATGRSAGDGLGAQGHLTAADTDGIADIAVGAPGENSGSGFVWSFRSSTATVVSPNGTTAFGSAVLGTDGTDARLGSGFAY
ncbi:FG-GAP repeat protein [Streptomyces sp. NPDC086549]|uniref:FG-GAP repeat protein n=1 Tax=Streptomyces sp. NPDC086549 TaxID=3365752 RepID=UPI003806C175